MLGVFVKAPQRYIDGNLLMIGESIKITSVAQTEIFGVGFVDVVRRGGGSGGGGEGELTGQGTANGERGIMAA